MTVKVYERHSGEYLGKGAMNDGDYARYEGTLGQSAEGFVQLDQWLDEAGREHVTAQDDTVVWFERVELRSAE